MSYDDLAEQQEDKREKHLKIVRKNDTMTRNRRYSDEIKAFFQGIDLKRRLKPGNRVLELGCGEGKILKDLWEISGYHIKPVGIDLDYFPETNILGNVKRLQPRLKAQLLIGDVQNLPFEDNSFNFIYSYACFRYVYDKLLAVKEAHRVLNVGGLAVIDFDKGIQPELPLILKRFRNHDQLLYDEIKVPDKINSREIPSYRLQIQKNRTSPLDLPPLVYTTSDFNGIASSVYFVNL